MTESLKLTPENTTHRVIIDVRSLDEYKEGAVAGSIHLPLEQFREKIQDVVALFLPSTHFILMCRSGMRASHAYGTVQSLGLDKIYNWSVYEGGMLKWQEQGFPVARCSEDEKSKTVSGYCSVDKCAPFIKLPKGIRRVMVVMGALVGIAGILVLKGHTDAAWISVVVGAGLAVSGFFGFCGLAYLLSKF